MHGGHGVVYDKRRNVRCDTRHRIHLLDSISDSGQGLWTREPGVVGGRGLPGMSAQQERRWLYLCRLCGWIWARWQTRLWGSSMRTSQCSASVQQLCSSSSRPFAAQMSQQPARSMNLTPQFPHATSGELSEPAFVIGLGSLLAASIGIVLLAKSPALRHSNSWDPIIGSFPDPER